MIAPCQLLRRRNMVGTMWEMLDRTNNDMLERGVFVYEHNNKIKTTDIQKGGPTGITIHMPRRLGLFRYGTPIGTIHTHPKERFESLASVQDIKTLTNSNLDFSAVVFDDGDNLMVDVFSRKEFTSFRDIQQEYHNARTNLDFAEDANDALHLCTLEFQRG